MLHFLKCIFNVVIKRIILDPYFIPGLFIYCCFCWNVKYFYLYLLISIFFLFASFLLLVLIFYCYCLCICAQNSPFNHLLIFVKRFYLKSFKSFTAIELFDKFTQSALKYSSFISKYLDYFNFFYNFKAFILNKI